MKNRKLSNEAWGLVNDTAQQLIDGGAGRLHWKMVALVLAEALTMTDADYGSLLESEYGGTHLRTETRTKQYLARAIQDILRS